MIKLVSLFKFDTEKHEITSNYRQVFEISGPIKNYNAMQLWADVLRENGVKVELCH